MKRIDARAMFNTEVFENLIRSNKKQRDPEAVQNSYLSCDLWIRCTPVHNLTYQSCKARLRTTSNRLVFTVEDILQLLHKINQFCALEPDEIHPRILKETSSKLANHLHLVFCQSPDEEIVTPIYETGG
ncbi:hypothetical protein T265_03086 [Opisthorchis viverrini]|uniref:Uncharacterized protein n=1 Tax=Opisthorchis viverrini TaxID=6198 RepID=A0A075AHU1_OPIVI|nr:hypothetical protein T265_03086 [Opisthorchis viverrini]KER30474.1 hypothetical protein T265_03086 [Opisthorchis viverrini]